MKTRVTITSPISSFLKTLLVVSLLLGIDVGPSYAQNSLNGTSAAGAAPGSPAGSYALSGFETVNPYSGNLNFSLPLLQVAGRGGMNVPVKLTINQKWIATLDPNDYNGTYYYYVEDHWWNDWFTTDKGYSPGSVVGRQTGDIATCPYNGTPYYNPSLTRLTFTTPDGTEHELVDQIYQGQPFNTGFCPAGANLGRGTVFVTTDGTHATFISNEPIYDQLFPNGMPLFRPSGLLMTADGTHYGIEDGRVRWQRDRNGNKLTFEYEGCCDHTRISKITDSLNREVNFQYDVQDGQYGLCDKITYKGFGGGERIIRISYKNLELVLRPGFSKQTGQQLFPSVYSPLAPQGSLPYDLAVADYNPSKVSEVWLPDGIRSYKFRYNSHGELARVELPTGGAIEYDWVDAIGLGSGYLPGIQYAPSISVYRRVSERRVYANGSSLDTKMALGPPESISGRSGYVMEDHYDSFGTLLGRTKHYYTGINNPTTPPGNSNAGSFYQSWRDGKEYQTEVFHSDGSTVLKRISYLWSQPIPFWYVGDFDLSPTNNPHIIETLTTLVDTNQVAKQTFGYDQFSNLTDTYEFDFGPGAPPAQPIRRTHTDYLTTNPINSSDYTANSIHIRSLPTQQSVFDASNIERARTTYEYDNYTTQPNHGALLPRTGLSGHESTFTTGYATRGNVTAITQYLLNNGTVIGSISAYTQYDIAGNVVKTIDGRGYETSLFYEDRFGAPDGNAQLNSAPLPLSSLNQTSFAFVTSVTNALNQTSRAQFDYFTGKPVDSEDLNGVVSSSYSENDLLDRLTKIIRAAYPDTAAKNQTKYIYDDANRIVTTTSDHNSFDDPYPIKSQTFYDGFGRTIETRTYEGGSNYLAVQQQYDALGRASKTSNPFRNGESLVWTITAFDSLGRVTSVTTPDNAVVNTSYSGNSVTVTDQAGKTRRSLTDGLGRLIRVDEPDASNNLGSVSSPVQPTNHSYDALDDLLTVTQGTQTRTFVYDSLRRLASSASPESGTMNYQYDNNGNLLIRTDARNVSTHYSYDALNRPIRRWYNSSNDLNATTNNSPALPAGVSATEEANYYYDAQALPTGAPSYSRGSATGLLVAATYGTGSSSGDYFGYDELGRPTLKIQQLGGLNYQVKRTYNRASGVLAQTYPSGHTVGYSYDPSGRVVSFGGTLGNGAQRTYANAILYSPFGGTKVEQLGTDTSIYNRSIYNSRGQLSEVRVSTSATYPATTDWNRGAILNQFSDQCNGPACNGTDNNGNLKRQEVFIPHNDQISSYTNWLQQYEYDSLNRLQRVKEINSSNTTMWQQEYLYDRWGNRLIHQTNTWGPTTGPAIPKPNFELQASTNRLYAPGDLALSESQRHMRYDAAGNLKKDTFSGGGDREHDGENKMTKAWANGQWQEYTYDADGRRVIRKANGVGTWQVYGFDGELLAEYPVNAATGRPNKEYGYRNGQLLVTADVPLINVAASANGGVATASSTLTSGGLTYSHNHAINGTRYATFTNDVWLDATFNTFPDWIQINFDGLKTISEIDVFTTQANPNNPVEPTPNQTFAPNGGITNFEVQYWKGFVWATVTGGSITGNGNVWRMIGFKSVDTTKIRILVNDSLTHDLSRIAEVEAWGYASGTLPTLTDDFDDNVRNTAKWNLYTVGPNPSPTYEQNGRLEIQSQYSATNSNYGGYVTVETLNLNGKQTSVEVVAPTTANGGGGNYAGLSWGDSPYRIMMSYHYIYYDNTASIFDPARDRYIRLRDDLATQTVYYESSPNGVTWEVRASRYRGPVNLDYNVRLYNGNTAGWTSVDLVIFDNFRVEASGSQAPAANMQWMVSDHLGTPRMVLDKTGSLAAVRRHDYLPFGEELIKNQGLRTSGLGYSKDFVRQQFTSQERDEETELDYFIARYYSSKQGRFLSVDPHNPILDSASQDEFLTHLAQPQQWNRYVSVINNPMKYVDPVGEEIWLTGSAEDQKEALARIAKMLGEARFKLVDYNQKNIGGKIVTVLDFGSEANKAAFEAIGGGNAYEKEFSEGMADIIGSTDAVEYKIAEKFDMKDCIGPVCFGKATMHSSDFGGAATVGKDESLTGNVQIFVSRNATNTAFWNMALKKQQGIKISSDGDYLYFTPEQIDAHEFGHAHNSVKWGMKVEPWYRAVRWENILRHRQGSSNTRLVH